MSDMKRPTDTEVQEIDDRDGVSGMYYKYDHDTWATQFDLDGRTVGIRLKAYDRADAEKKLSRAVKWVEFGYHSRDAEINRLKAVQAELVEALERYERMGGNYGDLASAALEKVRKAGGA